MSGFCGFVGGFVGVFCGCALWVLGLGLVLFCLMVLWDCVWVVLFWRWVGLLFGVGFGVTLCFYWVGEFGVIWCLGWFVFDLFVW